MTPPNHKQPTTPMLRLSTICLLLTLSGPALAQSPVTTFEYDAGGNRTRVVDPLLRPTQHGYDALNRLAQTTDAAGGVVRYGYDALDRLVSVTDPRSLVTGYQYDGLGNLLMQTSPDTGTTQYTHDAAGNVLTKTDAKGQVTRYQYDALNRLVRTIHADGSEIRNIYDQGANGIGRLTRIEEGGASAVTGATDYLYDALGRVIAETRTLDGVAYSTVYEYAGGRLSAMVYPSGRRLDYAYDAQGRVSQIRLTNNGQQKVLVDAVQRLPFGGVKAFAFGNGQAYARSIDAEGRIAGYSLGAQNWLIGYDAASRIAFQTDAANAMNTATYAYDNADRLTQAALPATTLGYAYDATGNRVSQTMGGTTYSYQVDPASNRLAGINTLPPKTYTYDANGSVTGDGQNQFGYDARGRMTSAVTALGTTQYRVGAQGQRVKKSNANEDTRYLYDLAGHLIAEVDATGTAKREYFWLEDLPVGVLQ